MKHWLTGALALCMASSAAAADYQLVYSPSLKLEIWIDNVKSKNVSDWCARTVPLRIVSRENSDPHVLDDFLPRVGGLMGSQCASLRTLTWQLNDKAGNSLASGGAEKAQEWKVEITPPAPVAEAPTAAVQPPVPAESPATTAVEVPPPPPEVRPEDLSPAADTTPWLQFSLMNGCHFRTWWSDASQTTALFLPGKKDQTCAEDGWLSGQSQMTRIGKGGSQRVNVTVLNGFPVMGLKKSDDALHITTVNRERLVLSNDKTPQSWLILPWQPASNSWAGTATVAVEMTPQEASDDDQLKARLNEVRKIWGSYLADGSTLRIALVKQLSPQLKDPAAGAFRTLN